MQFTKMISFKITYVTITIFHLLLFPGFFKLSMIINDKSFLGVSSIVEKILLIVTIVSQRSHWSAFNSVRCSTVALLSCNFHEFSQSFEMHSRRKNRKNRKKGKTSPDISKWMTLWFDKGSLWNSWKPQKWILIYISKKRPSFIFFFATDFDVSSVFST